MKYLKTLGHHELMVALGYHELPEQLQCALASILQMSGTSCVDAPAFHILCIPHLLKCFLYFGSNL